MKKIVGLLIGMLFAFSFAACDLSGILGNNPTSQSSETSIEESSSKDSSSKESATEDSTQTQAHPHSLKKVSEKSATCSVEGNVTYWYCETCKTYYSDANGENEITQEATIVPAKTHTLVKMSGKEATCAAPGKYTYYICANCTNTYLDEACTQPCDKNELVIPALPHNMVHHEAVPVVEKTNGVIEHWTCEVCANFFLDAEGKQQVSEAETVWYSVYNLVDFPVEVAVGKDPVVLQLTDTQIIDEGQERYEDRINTNGYWGTDKREERCYQFLRETIEATQPDLILLTGDIVYGEFDDNGSVWLDFVAFMDSFQIPWAPIFGNHENESAMGVDWQCEQLDKAEYCLFKQRELTGNGNYSVGIVQGNELKRVYYMLDSNGCGNPSAKTRENSHFTSLEGFGADQIAWYTQGINIIKAQSPDTKISFAYHIQQAIFGEVFKKYDYSGQKDNGVYIDLLQNKEAGDFGYIGRELKGPWDENYSIYNGMKALGVDSVFVGHEHCNSASIIYDGIRFQFGQKSSQYDRFNAVDANGDISGTTCPNAGQISLIGGTVNVLSAEDGSFKDGYIYYCENAGGNVDWSQFIQYEVNGLQKNDVELESGISMVAKPFDDTVNAYMVTAEEQGKIKFDVSMMRGKTTFTFTVYLEAGYNKLSGLGPYAIRLKPDGDSAAAVTGAVNLNGKYYVDYDVDTAEATRVEAGVWQTFTVDISSIAETCSEFSLIIAEGNTLYLRDMMFS